MTGRLEAVRLLLPIMGDANPFSHAGIGAPRPDAVSTSFIAGGEAAEADNGLQRPGNRFDDRHYGGVNFLFVDGHADRSTTLRSQLAIDWNLDGTKDQP